MKRLSLIFLFLLSLFTTAIAYEENVHHKITEKAIGASGLSQYLSQNLNIALSSEFDGKTVSEWVIVGSELEDASPRWINHFYDPTTGKGSIGLSSLQWGKGSLLNVYSWSWAREYYRLALTSSDSDTREKNFSYLFRAVGQVMHLVHDLAVPAHVRNDLHPYNPYSDTYFQQQRDMYEKYTKLNVNSPSLSYSGYPAVDNNTFNSFDTFWVNGGKGLAEYTNQNFLSKDTIFKSYASPQKVASSWILSPDIETDGKTDYRIYLTGETTEGESITHFVSTGYLWSELTEVDPEGMDDSRFNLDDNCHKDYASLLLPRAVGYSAGLLNYFFRGQINMEKDPQNVEKYIIKNESGERMVGTFTLYYDDINDNRREVANWSLSINANDKSGPVSFTSPTNPIPREQGKYILVFYGSLGNEEDVAVGREVKLDSSPLAFLMIKQISIKSDIVEMNYSRPGQFWELEDYISKISGTVRNSYVIKIELEWIGDVNEITNVTLLNFNNYLSCKYDTTVDLHTPNGHSLSLNRPTKNNPKGSIEIGLTGSENWWPIPNYIRIDTIDVSGRSNKFYEPIFIPVNIHSAVRDYDNGATWWNFL